MRKHFQRRSFLCGKHWWFHLIFLLLPARPGFAQTGTDRPAVDIVRYELQLAVDPVEKQVKGKVTIRATRNRVGEAQLMLACGDLVIDSVRIAGRPAPFEQRGPELQLLLPPSDHGNKVAVEIHYHGSPAHGMRFFPEARQVYTVFSTSQWMPCREEQEERADLHLTLILPKGLMAVGNGKLTAKKMLRGQQVQYSWKLKDEVPAYTFGFAAGPFQMHIARAHGLRFQYVSADYPEDSLRLIFAETPDMLRFFERKAGVHYSGQVYTQILPKGNISQEMAGFAVMRNNYGRQVLDDPTNVSLAAHELAHQWWGNQVTCRNWRHFWLNEGLAVFMAAAYREHRFGREAYLHDIEAYHQAYRQVADQGLDKPLVFPDWSHPSPEDRTLVYYKGAYFFHLLREKLGDHVFWEGLRNYTRKYFGKSVVSRDLQAVMEKTSGRDLSGIFGEWVY